MTGRATKYVVSWMLNGKSYSEEHDTMTMAYIRMFQLEAFKLNPTLHLK